MWSEQIRPRHIAWPSHDKQQVRLRDYSILCVRSRDKRIMLSIMMSLKPSGLDRCFLICSFIAFIKFRGSRCCNVTVNYGPHLILLWWVFKHSNESLCPFNTCKGTAEIKAAGLCTVSNRLVFEITKWYFIFYRNWDIHVTKHHF